MQNIALKTVLSVFVCISFFSCSKSIELTDSEKQWLRNNNNITVALFPYYPPYQFVNDKGNIDGIYIDFLELIEQKINHKFQRKVYTDWSTLVKEKKENKNDIILEIQQSPSRDEYLNFYAKLFTSPHTIVSHKDSMAYQKIEELKTKKITVPKDYAIHELLKEHYSYLNITTELDDLTCLQKVNDGTYDAYIGPKAVSNYFIKAENLSNLLVKNETKFSYDPGIAVTKNNKELNAIIKKAVKGISYSEKEAIINNWLFNLVKPFYKTTWFWIGCLIFILSVLSIIAFINFYLKYKVKQKTKELLLAKDKAEKSDLLKTNFIRNISHEIKTPMNGIIGFSEALKENNPTKTEQKEYTKIITQSANQLMEIIEDILEISALASHQIDVHADEVDLIKVLENLHASFEEKANNKKIYIRLINDIPFDKSSILIDRYKVTKILKSIIDNAIKFTSVGGVTIYSKLVNDEIQIKIEDTGIGINPKDQETIFNSFSQSEIDISKNYGGLGLGLSIAKENAKLIKGSISFTSTPEKGTIFTFKFPYNPTKSSFIQTTISGNQPYKEKYIILVVEDEDINFIFLKTLMVKMENYDFVVHRAIDGEEAVSLCQNNDNIDLVFMDVKMPVMDGYEATKRIKKIKPNLPVIAQTAYSSEKDIKTALDSGCDGFISKPVDQQVLYDTLTRYFKAKKQKSVE